MTRRMHDLNNQHHDRFLRCFAEHEPSVRTFVRSLLPIRADTSEVMREVVVVLWQKSGEFDAVRDFRKWAFGIARFEVLAFLRDRACDRHVYDEELFNKIADDAAESGQRHEAQREALEGCLQKSAASQPNLCSPLARKARG